MEIKRIGENKIRCALTEEEIQKLGFEIDEIIGNNEMTQKFMRVVLGIVEEEEHISLEEVSPMVKAELLQDHSMAITFGGESDLTFKSLVDTVNHLMSQIQPDKLKEFGSLSPDEKQAAVGRFLDNFRGAEAQPEKKAKKSRRREPMVCALRFSTLDHLIAMSHVCFPGKVPDGDLYKFQDAYYLILDFTGFGKEEMRPFAFGTVEYDDAHFSEPSQIAFVREQGTCIVRNDALQMLMQL